MSYKCIDPRCCIFSAENHPGNQHHQHQLFDVWIQSTEFVHRFLKNIILMTSFIGHNTPVHVTINTITFSMCAHDTRSFHDKNRLTIFLFDISIYVQIHNIYFFTHKILHMYTVMLFFFYSKFKKDNFTPMLTSGFQI